MQTLQPDEMLVVDSASSDDTVARFRAFGARVEVIDARDFNHGGTRRWASEQVGRRRLDRDDPGRHPRHPRNLRQPARRAATRPAATAWPTVANCHTPTRVSGRTVTALQLPLRRAAAKAWPTRRSLGIKTCFSSDSFSVYRRSALEAVGGFPSRRDRQRRRLRRRTHAARRL